MRDLKPLKAEVICFPKIKWIFKYKLSQSAYLNISTGNLQYF